MPLLIKACLNGAREPGAHPALPLTPAQLAAAAREAQQAGAGAVHVHPRGADGRQSLEAEDVAAAVVAVRAACPGLPVGVTTIATAEPDVARRLAMIRSWKELPDFASVNLSEPGAAAVCEALFAMGVGVEAGLARPADAQLLVELGIADRCLRHLIEVAGQADAALATAGQIEQVLDAAGTLAPRLLHGFGSGAWAVLEAALARGYDVRIGLEDTLQLPDGAVARDNAELVATAHAAAILAGRLQGA